jgi:hypothetical protein
VWNVRIRRKDRTANSAARRHQLRGAVDPAELGVVEHIEHLQPQLQPPHRFLPQRDILEHRNIVIDESGSTQSGAGIRPDAADRRSVVSVGIDLQPARRTRRAAITAITNNLRPAGSTAALGQFFGEYSGARDGRIIQLGVKVYF